MKEKITLANLKKWLPKTKDYTVWDAQIPGFGVKITPRGRMVYVLKQRFGHKQRWYTIGTHAAPWTPETARDEALRLLGMIKTGIDPATAKEKIKNSLSISELCDLYLKEGCPNKKPSTLYSDKSRIKSHITPLLGKHAANSISSIDVSRFMQDIANGKTACDRKNDKLHSRSIVKGGKGAATRTVGLLGGIMSYAVKLGLRTDNPVWGVERYKDKQNDRYLTAEELGKLGDLLNKLEKKQKESPFAINALRLLILTGARKSEILNAQWQHYDKENALLYLSDSKTGARFYNLGSAAMELLDKMPKLKNNPYIIPGMVEGKPFVGLQKMWQRVRAQLGLEDVRIHSLRHGFGSAAASANTSLLLIGKIMGHKNQVTTQRYAHLLNDPVREAANKASTHLAEILK